MIGGIENGDIVITRPNWEPYRGNNFVEIPRPSTMAMGSVSFSFHLGKPLSQRLWTDLMHRMCVTGLCIYGPNDGQWTIGWGPGHCTIDVTDMGIVEDISYCPHVRPKDE